MQEITSRENPLVKEYGKLRDQRRYRNERGLFVVEGLRTAREALGAGVQIESAFFTGPFLEREQAVASALAERAGEAFLVSASVAAKLADTQKDQGIFLICRTLDKQMDMDMILSNGRCLVLDGIQDPGNMGTILRTADAFGVETVVLSKDCCDLYNPKVVRSTTGSLFRLRLLRVEDLCQVLDGFRQREVPTYAAVLHREAIPLGRSPLPQNAVVVIGNEGNGVTQAVIDRCDYKLMIPMNPATESLNAGVSAAVILWEMARGR